MTDGCARPGQIALVLIALALVLTGCAGHAPRPGPFPDQAVPSGMRLAEVPFYAQDAYQCGPAALAMMLNTRGLDTAPARLREQVYLPARRGSLQVEMVAAARAHDMLVYPLERNLTTIITEVAAGNPVLVMQNLRFDWWPEWHFAVVVGYDLERRELILHSGLEQYKRTAFRMFDNSWARGDRWARVILPPHRLPATAQPLPWVRAALDLEQTGHHQAAAEAYATATGAWPDHLGARFARANHALSRERPRQASQEFMALLQRHPEFAPGWYNLALSLAQAGCPAASRQAQACARELAPGDQRFDADLTGTVAASDNDTGAATPRHCLIPVCP